MHIQESGEMYLETILILSKKLSHVRSIDVGEYMGFSKPSVSRAIGLLKNGGPSTDVFLKALGQEKTEWVFRSALFGTIQ